MLPPPTFQLPPTPPPLVRDAVFNYQNFCDPHGENRPKYTEKASFLPEYFTDQMMFFELLLVVETQN